jgi:hypothetical protein
MVEKLRLSAAGPAVTLTYTPSLDRLRVNFDTSKIFEPLESKAML